MVQGMAWCATRPLSAGAGLKSEQLPGYAGQFAALIQAKHRPGGVQYPGHPPAAHLLDKGQLTHLIANILSGYMNVCRSRHVVGEFTLVRH